LLRWQKQRKVKGIFMADNLDIQKLALCLNGRERAKLILKDFHDARSGNKRGFLSEVEKVALMRFSSHEEQKEFSRIFEIYSSSYDVMIKVIDLQVTFNYYHEQLKKLHLLLAQSVGLRMLKYTLANTVLARIKTETEYVNYNDSDNDYCLVIKGGKDSYWTDEKDGEIMLRRRIQMMVDFLIISRSLSQKAMNFLSRKKSHSQTV
jgi:hypothetical protein